MGIKYLWTILTPFCERKPLYELQGKTVAVDLSCWVCEAQNIAEYQVQPRMYLRNLYFRACYLLLMEVNPVFILEGKAPELKYDTIAARNAIQFKGAKPKTDGVKTGKDRSRFNHVLKRCEEMLGYMGLSCIKGAGEAESLCAYLNDENLVDGCISQDSDCFAYGAKVVYRNFSIASQGAYSASGGAVDIYDITKVNESMNFGRNKIVAMALLLGSDYSDGVLGVGKESVLKFFENLPDDETLDRLRSWKTNKEKYDKCERLISDKNICTSCGHHGKIQGHNRNGCGPCGMTKGCNAQKFKDERLKIKNELAIRNKALEDPNFPNENIIQEYLTKKDKVSKLDLEWRQPNLVKFVQFTTKFLQWEEIYAFEKILPIVTRWQCLNPKSLQTANTNKGVLHPSHIKKIRTPKGIPSYEIIWTDPEEYFKGLVPQAQIEESNTTEEKLWSTIEPQILVNKAYPKLVEDYQQSKIKPKKTTRRRKKEVNVDEVENLLKNTSILEPKPKRTRNVTKKIETSKGISKGIDELKLSKPKTMMDNFLKQAVLNSQKHKNRKLEASTNGEFEDILDIKEYNCHTSTPSKSKPSFMDISCFGDEDDDNDLSLIIENIISRKPPDIKESLKKINFSNIKDLQDKENLCMEENIFNEDLDERNHSSFFITGPVENDLFEKTFNSLKEGDDNDSTVEYEYDEFQFINGDCDDNYGKNSNSGPNKDDELELLKHKGSCEKLTEKDSSKEFQNIDAEDNDSFCDIYVPLLDRLKKKQ